jgi:preprotein translocase subunit SecD
MEVGIVAETSKDAARSISSDAGKRILLTEKPLLTIEDFASANVSLTEGQIVLNVYMTADGAKRAQAFTAGHVGKMIAFLVNGRVIRTPTVQDPITGKGFLIGPLDRDEAQKLADSINHKNGRCGPQRKSRR